jgi:hypothetical protein
MRRALAVLASTTAVVSLAPGCRPAKSPETQLCRIVDTQTSEEAVKAAFAATRAPLIVTDNAIQQCGCGARRLGGAKEEAKLGGNTEQDRLAGKTEENKLAGATEVGKTGGAMEKRAEGGATERGQNGGATEKRAEGGATEHGENGGATEKRAEGGAVEHRDLAGAIQPLTCREVPDCIGYVVSGAGSIRVYSAAGWSDSPNRCVIE